MSGEARAGRGMAVSVHALRLDLDGRDRLDPEAIEVCGGSAPYLEVTGRNEAPVGLGDSIPEAGEQATHEDAGGSRSRAGRSLWKQARANGLLSG